MQFLVLRQPLRARLALPLPWAVLGQLKVLLLEGVTLQQLQPDRVLLPELEQLELHRCSLHCRSCLLQLAASTKLTHLRVDFATDFQLSNSDDADCCQLLLQHLQHLVKLKLVCRAVPITTTSMQHISDMQHLQHLELSADFNSISCGPLPTSITRLALRGNNGRAPAELPPAVLQQLSNLQQLELQQCRVLDTALGGVPPLQHLNLSSCTLSAEAVNSPKGLTRLQSLDMLDTNLEVGQPQQLSALTASRHLRRLHIVSAGSAPLLPGMVRHMFPAASRQPLLRRLELRSGVGRECVGTEDLAAIARSCPRLCALILTRAVLPNTDLSCLKQLTACGSLKLEGAAITDHVAAVGIAQLTRLETLSLRSCRLTPMGLAALTTPKRLTSLTVTSPQRGGLNLQLSGRNVSGCVWSEASQRAVVSDQCIVNFILCIAEYCASVPLLALTAGIG